MGLFDFFKKKGPSKKNNHLSDPDYFNTLNDGFEFSDNDHIKFNISEHMFEMAIDLGQAVFLFKYMNASDPNYNLIKSAIKVGLSDIMNRDVYLRGHDYDEIAGEVFSKLYFTDKSFCLPLFTGAFLAMRNIFRENLEFDSATATLTIMGDPYFCADMDNQYDYIMFLNSLWYADYNDDDVTKMAFSYLTTGLTTYSNVGDYDYSTQESSVNNTRNSDFEIDSGVLKKYKGNNKNPDIPNSVTHIGEYAFCDCVSIQEIVIPDSVISIGYGAFNGCSSLERITLGKSVKSLGSSIFGRCLLLNSITFLGEVPRYPYSAISSLETIIISDGATIIDNLAFSQCQFLKNVIIGNCVKSIEEGAFSDCFSLQSLIVGDSVEKIDQVAFAGCNRLTNIKLGKSLKTIEMGAFSGCSSLESIDIPNSVKRIGDAAFSKCTKLKKVTLGNSINEIGKGIFIECSELQEIIVPDSVEELGDFAFNECVNLKKAKIGNSVKRICATFNGCNSLEEVTLGKSVTTIDSFAFKECYSLLSITIPESVEYINNSAFADCTNLKKIIIPKSVQSIKEDAFLNCSSLESVVICSKETNVSENAFKGCVGAVIQQDGKAPWGNIHDKNPNVTNGHYAFISYSTKNQNFAEATHRLLLEEGIGVWMAPYDIPAGSKYAHVINNAIENSSCVLLLLSKESQASEWVDKEIERAVNYKKTIISMHIDESKLNAGFGFYLGNQQIVPVKTINKNDENVRKVLVAIRSFVK